MTVPLVTDINPSTLPSRLLGCEAHAKSALSLQQGADRLVVIGDAIEEVIHLGNEEMISLEIFRNTRRVPAMRRLERGNTAGVLPTNNAFPSNDGEIVLGRPLYIVERYRSYRAAFELEQQQGRIF